MAQSALGIVVVAAVLSTTSVATAAEPGRPVWNHRVRSADPRFTAVMVDGLAHSETFRDLVARVDRTDGLVFVTEGRCRPGIRACLSHALTMAGLSRLLYVIVNAEGSRWDLVGSLAHELTHALEVLGEPTITSSAAIFFFYLSGGRGSGERFETAAVAAGARVRREMRLSSSSSELAQQPELGTLPVALDRRR